MAESSERLVVPTASERKFSAKSAISVTLWTRLWFIWFAIVTSLATFPAALGQVLSHQVAPTARNFKRWAKFWATMILGGTGVRVQLKEQGKIDQEQPYIFVANHQNTLDIMALAAHLPYPFGFVAKVELSRVPVLGIAMRNSASIFIDRSDPRKSLASIQHAGRRIREGNSVLLFAEGTRSFTPQLQPFKKGAFVLAVEAGIPMVPITLLNSYQFMDERRLVGRPGTIQCIVGTPISVEGKRRRDIPALMEEVRDQMEQALAEMKR